MNTNIYDSLELTLNFLNEIIYQLNNYNTIDSDSLKLLSYLVYKQNTINKYQEIEYPLMTALSFINKDTKVYNNKKPEVKDEEKIFYNFINNKIKTIFGD